VAGNHAGLIYNTWPLMGEHFLPDSLFYPLRAIGMEALFDDVTLVQFNHRFWAYVLLALTLWHAWAVSRAHKGTSANRRANALVWMLSAQAGIGIATLVLVAPMWLALIHQGFAMMVLAMFAVHAAAGQREASQPVPAPAGKRRKS
jgi:cytochrome c oxidase assembly protein subunit 15